MSCRKIDTNKKRLIKELLSSSAPANLPIRNQYGYLSEPPEFCYWIWNLTDNTLHWPFIFYRMMNIPPDITPDFTIWAGMLSPPDLETFADTVEEVLDDMQPRNITIRMVIPGEGERTVEFSFLYVKTGETDYLLGICEYEGQIDESAIWDIVR
jgi:hypothetical protein